MFAFIPLLVISLSNLFDEKSAAVEIVLNVFIVLAFAVMAYYLITLMKHKNDTFVLEITPDFILVGEKKFELDKIRLIQISNSTLWLKVGKRWWNYKGYLLEADVQQAMAAALKEVADRKGFKFRIY